MEIQAGVVISGTVVDEAGEPLPGVVVAVKGTNTVAMTDNQGKYSIRIPDASAVLSFSYIGYETFEAASGGRSPFNVTLAAQLSAIDDVVVIGYGTVRKSDLTGSVASISSEKFKNLPQTGVTDILQGKAAGVNITSTSGGGAANIRIRGITSLNKSSEPLWVVDGVIGGQIGNVYNIQSIEVLKDASSTAIYGSQGANGVILVTTKKAQEGRAQITFDARYRFKTMRKTPDLLNPWEYATAWNDFNGTGMISDEDMSGYKNGTLGVDWIDLMTQTGFRQEYNLNITGGSNKTKYDVSAWGGDEKGQIVTSTARDYNVKAMLDTEVTPWFNLSGYLYGGLKNTHNDQSTSYSAFSEILVFSAAMTELQNEEGAYNLDTFSPYARSPLSIYATDNDRERFQATGFTDLRFKIIDGLTLSVQGLYSRDQNTSRYFESSRVYPGAPNRANNSQSVTTLLRNINNLTYQKEFGDHRLTAMAVFEATKSETSGFTAESRNLPYESLGYWNLGTGGNQYATNSYTNSAMISTFGRVIYSYKGKYLFTGTMRADAPSQFVDKYKWGYFPSVALGWNVAEESFMNKDLIQQLKLRASVGSTGNHGVGAYSTMTTMTQQAASWGLNQTFTGFWEDKFANRDLRWEKTLQYDLGFDLSILNQRLDVTVDWYYKNTTDMLYEKPLPLYNGGGTIWTNLGRMTNNGWEFTVTGYPFRGRNFTWESNFTASYTNNIVRDLAGDEIIYPDATRGGRTGPLFALKVGEPIGIFNLQSWAGFDEGGANLFRTADGGTSTTPNTADRVIVGRSIPKWQYGWSNQFTYKNWDLNVFFRATGRYNRINLSRYYQSSRTASAFINSREAYYLNWDKVEDKKNAKYASYSNPRSQYVAGSTQFLEEGQFLRLQNLSLGYNLPRKLTKFADIHLSLNCENVFVITKYSGLDPETVSEVDSDRQDKTFGMDDGSFPIPRTWSFVVRFNF